MWGQGGGASPDLWEHGGGGAFAWRPIGEPRVRALSLVLKESQVRAWIQSPREPQMRRVSFQCQGLEMEEELGQCSGSVEGL